MGRPDECRRHIRLVLRVCTRILGSGPDAEDAAQDTLEKFMRASFREECRVSTYLYAIATRVCIDRLRKIRRDERLLRDWTESQKLDGNGRELRLDNLLLLMQVLDDRELADDTADAVVCYYVHGMTEQEISETLDMNRRTVSYRLSRFVETARRRLGEDAVHG